MADHIHFRPDAVDPETAQFNRELEALLAAAHGFDAHPRQLARRARTKIDEFITARPQGAPAGG